jgi:hypothetical protein
VAIQIGTQIFAPSGFRQLRSGVTYYFVKSGPRGVLLLELEAPPNRTSTTGKLNNALPRPRLVNMPRSVFESALEQGNDGLLKVGPAQTVPPWLTSLAGKDLQQLDSGRKSAKRSHVERIQARFEFIRPALTCEAEILTSRDPEKTLNKFAAACSPKQHPMRFRLWFFSYLAFGRNPLALHYNTSNIGTWDRNHSKTSKKRGAPSKYGAAYGFNVDSAMETAIRGGFEEVSARGLTKWDIYDSIATKIFNCRLRIGAHGYREYYQPDGNPFPSYTQCWYVIGKHYPAIEVRRDLQGPSRVRTESAPSAGRFTESVCNLMERVEADGYVLAERPRGLIDGTALKPLIVVRIRCVAAGYHVGIGFSLGGERASAYRMALFCAAIPKVLFCSLFGIRIDESRWPGEGLPPSTVLDRGPASGPNALTLNPDFTIRIGELAPAYAGQSKATIESTHPKKRRNLEAPEYKVSAFSAVKLARREIRRLILDNETIDISPRLTPDLVGTLRKHNPLSLWNELERRGRNDSVPMEVSSAVRTFLEQHRASITPEGVNYLGRRYDSLELRRYGSYLLESHRSSIEIKVYVLPACARHIWMDCKNRLLMLDLMLPLRSPSEEHYVSLDDLEQWQKLENQHRTLQSTHRAASRSMVKHEFEEVEGTNWDAGTRKRGKAPRPTRLSKIETSESNQDF